MTKQGMGTGSEPPKKSGKYCIPYPPPLSHAMKGAGLWVQHSHLVPSPKGSRPWTSDLFCVLIYSAFKQGDTVVQRVLDTLAGINTGVLLFTIIKMIKDLRSPDSKSFNFDEPDSPQIYLTTSTFQTCRAAPCDTGNAGRSPWGLCFPGRRLERPHHSLCMRHSRRGHPTPLLDQFFGIG